jgi:hypothetical protein
MAIADAEELRANNGKGVEDVLKHVPQTDLIAKDNLIKTCRQNGIGRNLVADLVKELLDDDQLFEVLVPRRNKRPKVLISRKPVTLAPSLVLDAVVQNSQGHYVIPSLKEPKKEL